MKAFDPDKLEVFGSSKLGDEVVAQVRRYDEGEAKLAFVKLSADGERSYPVRGITAEQFDKLCEKQERIKKHFEKAGVNEDSDDDDDEKPSKKGK